MKQRFCRPYIAGMLLVVALLGVGGLFATASALVAAQAAHHCCEQDPGQSAASHDSGCHCCPSFLLTERAGECLPCGLAAERTTFPRLEFPPPRTLRGDAIDYPPEAA